MKKFFTLLVSLGLCSVAHAGLITHTDYTAGTVITSAGQNTNENTIYNEFNGNIESANIKDGTIVSGDIADNTIAVGKLATVVQSTITYGATLGSYRRPNLVYNSVLSVDVETNTVITNQTCIYFLSERRCVTEDLTSTQKYRRFLSNQSANFTTGPAQGGLFSGVSLVNNQWYSIFAVKSQVSGDANSFVLVGTTIAVVQTSVGYFDANFGTGGWVFLGYIKNGNESDLTTGILNFKQVGNFTVFLSTCTGNAVSGSGSRYATSASANTLSITMAQGMVPSRYPNSIVFCRWTAVANGAAGNATLIKNSSGTTTPYMEADNVNGKFSGTVMIPCQLGLTIEHTSGAANTAMDIFMNGFIDGALGDGINSQL